MKKRIIVHDYAGHPFQVQLSRALAKKGHEVLHLYYGNNNTPKGELQKRNSDPDNLIIEPIFTKEPINKYSYIKRWLQDIEYGKVVSKKINQFKPNVVISANTPLDALNIIQKKVKLDKGKFIFWLQDVSGIASYKILKKQLPVIGDLIGKYHISLERKLMRQSDKVVLIADEFISVVSQWGIDSGSLVVIPNWAPLEDISVHEKDNSWSRKFGLSDKFCFLYTGGLGLKHNPDLLLQLALHFLKNDRVRVVVISEGRGAEWLKGRKEQLNLNNLILLDYQPFTEIPYVIASGDVLVAVLESDAGAFSVPSKVLTYLCAKRSLLLAVPNENLSSKIVIQNQAGFVVEPSDITGFINSAENILMDKKLREKFGQNARNYAELTFNIEAICNKFEAIL